MPAILLVAVGGTILTFGDIIFKFWVIRPSTTLYITGIAVYIVGLMFFVQSFKTENIAIASAMLVIFNILTLTLVSWLYFGEKISLAHLCGIALAIAAIAMFELI